MGPMLKSSALPGRPLPALMLSGLSLLLPPQVVQSVLTDATRLFMPCLLFQGVLGPAQLSCLLSG